MIELKDIIKTENILKISPEETLSYVLARMRTSHDAAFIFDGDVFLGVINPYYALIKSSFPGNAKAKHCLYHPPKVHIDYSIAKVAELFIESKIHYLPVFDNNDKFLGIISARHLLSQFTDSPYFSLHIEDMLKTKNKPVVSVYEDDTVNTAVHIFKKTKVSKLVVIGKDFKMKGVLSYYDLISYLISPRVAPHKGEREGNHISFYHLKVKQFSKKYALTLKSYDLVKDALDLILSKKIGSVIIIDEDRHPIGVITTKDFLRLLVRNGNGKKFEIKGINLSSQSLRLGGFFNQLTSSVRKFPQHTFSLFFH